MTEKISDVSLKLKLQNTITYEQIIIKSCEDFRTKLKNPDSMILSDVYFWRSDLAMNIEGTDVSYEGTPSYFVLLCVSGENSLGGSSIAYGAYQVKYLKNKEKNPVYLYSFSHLSAINVDDKEFAVKFFIAELAGTLDEWGYSQTLHLSKDNCKTTFDSERIRHD